MWFWDTLDAVLRSLEWTWRAIRQRNRDRASTEAVERIKAEQGLQPDARTGQSGV